MSHHRYQTEGIVLGSAEYGESNRIFFIFTKDYGLIPALAQGARNITSKLRPALSDFRHIDIDLIRGQDVWRVVDARERAEMAVFSNDERICVFARSTRLLRRLIHGERKEGGLFSEFRDFRTFLTTETLSPAEYHGAELVMALKILDKLGYGSDDENIAGITGAPFSREALRIASLHVRTIASLVNTRLKESHL